MDVLTVGGKIVAATDLGGAIGVAEQIERNNVQIIKHQARIAEYQAANEALALEAKKHEVEEATKEEKIKLVKAGIKKASDFPSDDWLIEYEPKK